MHRRIPVLQLAVYFCSYKALLLILAFSAPGPGYDTSTTLLPGANKLVRWDALYFVQKAQRGDIFEQEWAFGKGLSTALATITAGSQDIHLISVAGIVLSHITHFLATLLIFAISTIVIKDGAKEDKTTSVPLMAAYLYIIAPAGVFLSAPYAEAPFAFLNILGLWLYSLARCSMNDPKDPIAWKNLSTVVSGIVFGVATIVRSNGLLSGLIFVCDAIEGSVGILQDLRQGNIYPSRWARFASTIMAGSLHGLISLIPQWLGYREYCVELAQPRPWCNSAIPSIFSFVQEHYWNVGFLRYWTLSNVPLFLLAAPMLWLLIRSSKNGLDRGGLALRLALPQLVLAILAITNYHVQIITRLASAYPWVYVWLATRITPSAGAGWEVHFFVLYGLIQAGLYASFLPPA